MPPPRQPLANLFLVVFTRVPAIASGADLCQVVGRCGSTRAACKQHHVTTCKRPQEKTSVLPATILFYSPSKCIILNELEMQDIFPSFIRFSSSTTQPAHIKSFKNGLTERLFYPRELWPSPHGPTVLRLQLAAGIMVLLLDLALLQLLPQS